MANYAVIIEGIVDNIIVAETKEIAESVTGQRCIIYDPNNKGAHIGLKYDSQTGFEQPSISQIQIKE